MIFLKKPEKLCNFNCDKLSSIEIPELSRMANWRQKFVSSAVLTLPVTLKNWFGDASLNGLHEIKNRFCWASCCLKCASSSAKNDPVNFFFSILTAVYLYFRKITSVCAGNVFALFVCRAKSGPTAHCSPLRPIWFVFYLLHTLRMLLCVIVMLSCYRTRTNCAIIDL